MERLSAGEGEGIAICIDIFKGQAVKQVEYRVEAKIEIVAVELKQGLPCKGPVLCVNLPLFCRIGLPDEDILDRNEHKKRQGGQPYEKAVLHPDQFDS
jgi:hypothetical protein